MNTNVFSEIYNDGKEKGIKKGIEKGVSQEKLTTARKMLKLDYSIEDIMKITGLSKKQIKEL